MKQPNSIYFYKMTADNGGAPCVHKGVLSLAICKPQIRRTAEVDDLVFGFGGKRLGGRLIYAAFVTDKPEVGDYYKKLEYRARPDCIYRALEGRPKLKANARFHTEDDQSGTDVGKRFEKAHVLLSDDFRYFGAAGTTDYQKRHKKLAAALRNLGRGHRVNHPNKVREELCRLAEELWGDPPSTCRVQPSDDQPSWVCNTGTRPVRC